MLRGRADAATVMGAAPDATVQTCVSIARDNGKQTLIDLLATDADRQEDLLEHEGAVFGLHLSKDVQETGGGDAGVGGLGIPGWATGREVAIAGGIRLEDVPMLKEKAPGVRIIVGSAITGAENPATAAQAFAAASGRESEGGRDVGP